VFNNEADGGEEECDDDNEVDTDMCRNTCLWNVCGDGVIDTEDEDEVEECDFGEDNANGTWPCTTADEELGILGCRIAVCDDDIEQTSCMGGSSCEDDCVTCDMDPENTEACTSCDTCQAPCAAECDACISEELTPTECANCDACETCEVEECDNGVDNDDRNDCTSTCQDAECGDGLLHDGEAGTEECDDAEGNDDATGVCNTSCELPECGDGNEQSTCPDCEASCDDCLSTGSANDCAMCFDCQDCVAEECDNDGENADDAACTLSCTDAVCGDGLTYTGVEDCDDGEANDDNADCTSTCETASCGDGLLHNTGAGTEECDAGESNADATGICNTSCEWPTCGDGVTQTDCLPNDIESTPCLDWCTTCAEQGTSNAPNECNLCDTCQDMGSNICATEECDDPDTMICNPDCTNVI
jgi:hypothetical protein